MQHHVEKFGVLLSESGDRPGRRRKKDTCLCHPSSVDNLMLEQPGGGPDYSAAPMPGLPPPPRPSRAPGVKMRNCKKCENCLNTTDCGTCKNCLDKPKFGGPGTRKQPCLFRKCKTPVMEAPPDAATMALDAESKMAAAAAAAEAKANKGGGAGAGTRMIPCRACPNCVREDCGTCKNCLDKPKFGGPGTRKQPCLLRKCLNPVLTEVKQRGEKGTSPDKTAMAAAALAAQAEAIAAAQGLHLQAVGSSRPGSMLSHYCQVCLPGMVACNYVTGAPIARRAVRCQPPQPRNSRDKPPTGQPRWQRRSPQGSLQHRLPRCLSFNESGGIAAAQAQAAAAFAAAQRRAACRIAAADDGTGPSYLRTSLMTPPPTGAMPP